MTSHFIAAFGLLLFCFLYREVKIYILFCYSKLGILYFISRLFHKEVL